jgi:hypothetical protein
MTDIDCNKEVNYTDTIEDIENEIYYDINSLLQNVNPLYKRDKFKSGKDAIDIIYPRHNSIELKDQINSPDNIRFLLSLYPVKEDLCKIKNIILRPRHIEIENTELISLFMCREKTLIYYLHHPFLYLTEKSDFFIFNNSLKPVISELHKKSFKFNENIEKEHLYIPPIWYIISTLLSSSDDRIENYFVKRNTVANSGIIHDISYQYSLMGY